MQMNAGGVTGKRAGSAGLVFGLAGWLFLTAPVRVRAEGSVSYKYMDYREAAGRIVVQTQSALVEQSLGTDLHLKVMGVIDAIAGATPNGQPAPAGSDQVVLTQLHERRKAWSADLSRQFSGANLAVGVAGSRESDYTSTGWSLNSLTDWNGKNTTLLAGVAGTDDRVRVFYQTPWAAKHTVSFIAGVTQLLGPRTVLTVDFTAGHASGYLSDQYKLVQKSSEVAPGVFLPFTYGENRPATRTQWIALALLNHALPDQAAAVEASYRFYHDTYGVDAHTLELSWLQRLGAKLVLKPALRLYEQSAADFYHYQLDQTAIEPAFGPPRLAGPFYSSDYRLSAFRSSTCGLQVIWTPSARLQFDAGVSRYDMRGRDGVTPQSAYVRAALVTVGAKFSW